MHIARCRAHECHVWPRCWSLAWLLLAMIAFCDEPLRAQDLRVYTRVYLESAGPGNKVDPHTPVARSNTLFHAGKAYDLLDHVGEMTVFEPAQERFLIVNSSRLLITQLSFSQIEDALHQTESRARKSLQGAPAGSTRVSAAVREAVQFQLNPKFQESYLPEQNRMLFEHPSVTYTVQTAASPDPAITEAYYRYANWTARMNFVLRPQPTLPGPRLAVNAALARQNLLPVTVRLESRGGKTTVMRAEHSFEWKLGVEDRKQLKYWEGMLVDPRYKRVEFGEFQKAMGQSLAARK